MTEVTERACMHSAYKLNKQDTVIKIFKNIPEFF